MATPPTILLPRQDDIQALQNLDPKTVGLAEKMGNGKRTFSISRRDGPASKMGMEASTFKIHNSRCNGVADKWEQKETVDCMLGYDADMMTVEYCRGFQ